MSYEKRRGNWFDHKKFVDLIWGDEEHNFNQTVNGRIFEGHESSDVAVRREEFISYFLSWKDN